jgi:hypothetical protein
MSKAIRKYEAGVERALGLFDTTNEWADYIAFLSRLHRALQGGPDGADVPFKQTVAKYLAQCLTPALPSGVHQKALQVYASIFSVIGKERLAQDLSLYLPGVSHTLSFGSLSVRPLFLLLIRDHVLRLPPLALRPALKAILLSLLPGLEDESTEDFETTLATVSEARIIFAREGSEGFFWQSLFLATITSPNRRSGAFVYLARHLPILRYHEDRGTSPQNGGGTEEDSLKLILSPEPGLLIRCFAAGLLDEQILVQRNFLDLLVTHLPIGALSESKRVVVKDIETLVSAAVSVVLRRDMSLNKRLWSWFQGPEAPENGVDAIFPGESKNSKQLENGHSVSRRAQSYFKRYSLAPLTQSLMQMIRQEPKNATERARPYRIALSLMDKWEIGGPVVAATFVPLMRSLKDFHAAAATEESYAEVYRSANVFFDGVESNLIWTQIFRLYEQDDWDLIDFMISRFNFEEEEMLVLHLPLFAVLLCGKLALGDDDLESPIRRQQIQKIFLIVLNLIPERAYESRDTDVSNADGDRDIAALGSIETFYSNENLEGRAPKPPFSRAILTKISLHTAADTFLRCLAQRSTSILDFTQAFALLVSKVPNMTALEKCGILAEMEQHVQTLVEQGPRWSYLSSSSITVLLVALKVKDDTRLISRTSLELFVQYLTAIFWEFLSPSTPQYHVDAVQYIVSLHGSSQQSRVVESRIVSLVTSTASQAEQRLERYSVLWNLAGKEGSSTFLRKPLLCVVDLALLQNRCDPAKSWIRNLPFASLEVVYQSVFEEPKQDQISRSLGLLNLQTEEQWLAITTDAGQHIRQFLSARLLELLIFARSQSLPIDHDDEEVLEVLSMLRLLHSHGALEIDEAKVLSMLGRLLEEAREGSLLQYTLIEIFQEFASVRNSAFPAEVLNMLLRGIAGTVDQSVDQWITFTCAVIMLHEEKLFQILLRVTDCFCTRLEFCLVSLQELFGSKEGINLNNPEKLTTNLLGGLEYVLARAHQRLGERDKHKTPKSPDQPQGLFESMQAVAGQASTEEKQLRSSFANDRLTVILCFQDTIKLCYRYWSWGTASHASATGTQASLYHVTSKIRSKSRRILDNLLDAEPQECLETLVGLWADTIRTGVQVDSKRVLNLLQSLKGGRPRLILPITFNAIYNRTNPAALDKSQRSTLSTSLSAVELACFLVEYTSSLEDDLVEEIWLDCTTFLREVLANPMPHRQILLHLLEFIAVLCNKIENTNFGEEYKMRRELGDICLRLFTAIFTVKPGGFEPASHTIDGDSPTSIASLFDTRNLLQVLCNTIPPLSHVLTDSDRFASVLAGIGTNITGPLLRSKTFPQNNLLEALLLLQIMSKPASSNRGWRKDVLEAFIDARFFASPLAIVRPGWLPLLRQLLLTDKTLLPTNLSQLTVPTTAGIMFGVGATAARTEADKRTQAILRRITLLFIAAEADSFAGHVGQIHLKVEQLLLATKESSPSSAIRPEVYMLLRGLIITTSPIHLALLWPTIDADLRGVFLSLTDKDHATQYSPTARLQAAKLLDLLLLLRPDEFQVHEWLFVTDTVDAIYPPADFVPSSLSDMVARTASERDEYPLPTTFARKLRKPWLCSEMSREVPIEDIDTMLLQPFFRQLSIHAFEDIYSLAAVDKEACVDDLIADLFTS